MRGLKPWLLLAPLVAGCATPERAPQPGAPRVVRPGTAQNVPPTLRTPPPTAGFRAPVILRAPGLERVIEQDAAGIVRQFGEPRLDVREGDTRKLQFAGEACVLDVYLYPLREGDQPVATHVEARRASDGREVDRAACVEALRRGG